VNRCQLLLGGLAAHRFACGAEACKRIVSVFPNSETTAVTGIVSIISPVQVTLHLVQRIETIHVHQALGQAQGHGSIIGPLAWIQTEMTTATHICDRLKRTESPKILLTFQWHPQPPAQVNNLDNDPDFSYVFLLAGPIIGYEME